MSKVSLQAWELLSQGRLGSWVETFWFPNVETPQTLSFLGVFWGLPYIGTID